MRKLLIASITSLFFSASAFAEEIKIGILKTILIDIKEKAWINSGLKRKSMGRTNLLYILQI